jgi:hypothetical protein
LLRSQQANLVRARRIRQHLSLQLIFPFMVEAFDV